VWFEIETHGVAAHGSRPDIGVDAIAKMGKVLAAIEEMGARLSRSQGHDLLGQGSIHASLIQGGQELSSYPAACRLGIERRTIPDEGIDDIEKELQQAVDRIAREDHAFKATVRRVFAREPFQARGDEPIVQLAKRHVESVRKTAPVVAGMSGWMDSALIAAAGIPAVILGPQGMGLHGETEWVDLDSVHACTAVALGMAQDFCR
jgi:acetylornithine deacetylase